MHPKTSNYLKYNVQVEYEKADEKKSWDALVFINLLVKDAAYRPAQDCKQEGKSARM
jgi:hypothetical protein